jgi:D-proline reductase (dithiol) PrdB
MRRLPDSLTAILVQLFKRIPWLARRWARTHRFVEGAGIPWAPVRKPVAGSVVALVTTAGVHLKTQPPFDMEDPNGDPSYRIIPSGSSQADLAITHKYYDHSAADRDLNVVLPLDRLRELAAERQVGGVGPFVYGFMGHITARHLRTLMDASAPEVARRLRADGVDAVLLAPA